MKSIYPFVFKEASTRAKWLAILFAVALNGSILPAAEPELVVVNAKVITVDSRQPQAAAFAIHGGKFTAVGSDDEIRKFVGKGTKVIDAKGRVVVPGFYDAHIHPLPVYDEMSRLGIVDLPPSKVKSIDALVARLREKAAVTPKGQWIKGDRYQDTKLGRHPTREDLDRASTEHPIYLNHSSWHIAAVNSYALKLAKVDDRKSDPKGGSFDRDATGKATGVVRETAMKVVLDAGPEPPQATPREELVGIQACFDGYLKNGITSIAVAGTSPKTLDLYRRAINDRPTVRLYVMIEYADLAQLLPLIERDGRGDNWLKLGAIKHRHGNSLSGRTCWLYEPYHGRENYYGIPPKDSQAVLNDTVLAIHRAGLQACIHSNGDREIDMVLTAIKNALTKLPKKDHRHRIEHASVVNEKILKRCKRLGVVLVPHSYIWEHGDKMEAYGPKRFRWMHANRSAIDLGIPIAGNSDAPVSDPRPMLRIQSMVTRRSAEGKVYGPEQRVTVEQAIHTWTQGSAYASFDENIKGSITVGKLADFVVLSADPREVPTDQIKDIQIDLTAVDGRVVYRGKSKKIAE